MTPVAMALLSKKRVLVWLCLAAIVALFLGYLGWLRPAGLFGHSHDDTIFFSSARSLAEGRGYILPSLPDTPYQTKYPVLYPWLLSWVWRWWPAFPANVTGALWMTAAFSCCFLLAAFQFVRRLEGPADPGKKNSRKFAGFSVQQNQQLAGCKFATSRSCGLSGDWLAVVVTALCAFHPVFLTMSAAVLSDTLFMALALAALIVAEAALREQGSVTAALASGLLAGFAVLTRSLGVAIIAGILVAAVYRRAYRQGAVFALAAGCFLAGGAVWNHAHSQLPSAGSDCLGWQQTWAYYTSYGDFWKQSVPSAEVFRTMVTVNLRDILTTPALLALFPPPGGEGSYPCVLLGVTLSIWILAGVARQARRQWQPIHFSLVFTCAIVLFWNYNIADRYLMLFLPLFYAGIWVEGRHLISIVHQTLRGPRPAAEKALAAGFALVMAAVAVHAAHYYVGGIRPYLRAQVKARAALLPEKEEAYRWIVRQLPPDARLVAYEDASLYLYTGRQAMLPIAFTNGAFYSTDPAVMGRELAHFTDVAQRIGARYWLFAEGDFYREWGSARVRQKLAELRSALPVVFRSSHHKVEIYDLSPILRPQQSGCSEAVAAASRN